MSQTVRIGYKADQIKLNENCVPQVPGVLGIVSPYQTAYCSNHDVRKQIFPGELYFSCGQHYQEKYGRYLCSKCFTIMAIVPPIKTKKED